MVIPSVPQDKKKEQWDRTKMHDLSVTSNYVDKIIAEAVEENTILTPKQKDFCFFFVKSRNAVQAYIRAYQTTYRNACAHAWALLNHDEVAKEIKRLRILKNTALGGMTGEDIVELHMRIAFADMTDFVEFGNRDVPLLKDDESVLMLDCESDEVKVLAGNINEVRLKPSDMIDGNLISEVYGGREGVKIKLADRQKSLAFLAAWFELNPIDKHRMAYDNAILAQKERETKIKEEQHNSQGKVDPSAYKEQVSGLMSMFGSPHEDRRLEDYENIAPETKGGISEDD